MKSVFAFTVTIIGAVALVLPPAFSRTRDVLLLEEAVAAAIEWPAFTIPPKYSGRNEVPDLPREAQLVYKARTAYSVYCNNLREEPHADRLRVIATTFGMISLRVALNDTMNVPRGASNYPPPFELVAKDPGFFFKNAGSDGKNGPSLREQWETLRRENEFQSRFHLWNRHLKDFEAHLLDSFVIAIRVGFPFDSHSQITMAAVLNVCGFPAGMVPIIINRAARAPYW